MKNTRSHYRSIRRKFSNVCVIIIIVSFVGIFYFAMKDFLYVKNYVEKTEIKEVLKKPVVKMFSRNSFKGEKIVHIDLKGAPPKVDYYKHLFPLLAKFGATGILLEYEDMFPYSDNINISAKNAYTLKDIEKINALARKDKLKIIPLVQTFGHLEFILKLEGYKELREVSEYPQVICPSHKNTNKIIETILQQIIDAHPNIKYIHIGADEVYYLGVCERCTDIMLKYNLSKNLLFMKHVENVINVITRKYPDIKILMWDDQFRSFSEQDLKIGYLDNIQPVIWKYSKEVYDELGPTLWDSYQKVFKNVWVASAFKGATESNEIVPHVTHYLQNHHSWMSVISEYSNQFNFQGIIITGWQRYDHFSILCELLPVGLPTLAMCLRIILGYNDSPLRPPTEIAKLLKCAQPYALIGPVFGSPKCTFPGGDILENVIRFQQLKQEFESCMDDSRIKGWMSDYNVAHCFSNVNYVESVTASIGRIKGDLNEVKSLLISALSTVYDKYTVDEWIETHVEPLEKQVNVLVDIRKRLLEKKTWNRRPFLKEPCK